MALRSHRDFQTYLLRIETTGSRLNECDTRLRQESEAETVATKAKSGTQGERVDARKEQGGEESRRRGIGIEGGGIEKERDRGSINVEHTQHSRAREEEHDGRTLFSWPGVPGC